MKKYKVLLGDPEERFAVALMNYINCSTQLPFLAMAFTNPADIKAYLSEHKADLLVISSLWKAYWRSQSETMQPLLWITEENYAQTEKEEEHLISKYSTGTEYVRCMLKLLSREHPLPGVGAGGSCIAVYSPVGRCGKTRLSQALCQGYTGHGMEGGGLYLGMEEYGNPDMEYHKMEELLYYIKQQAPNLSIKLKTLAQNMQGYDYIPSPLSYRELWELERADIAFLLNAIRQEGYYSLLVADIGAGSLIRPEILTEFDGIYLPYVRDKKAEGKVWAFCQVLKNLGLWKTLSEYCYPICMEDRELMPEEGRELEQDRQDGKLIALNRLYEERRH